MSYILEALRKADAERERERGSVPDLHAQLLPPGVSEAEVATARSALPLWLGLGVLLAAVAGAAWLVWIRDDRPPAVPSPPGSLAAPGAMPPPALARGEAPAPAPALPPSSPPSSPASSQSAAPAAPSSLPPAVPPTQTEPAASPPARSPAPKVFAKAREPAKASAAASGPLARPTAALPAGPKAAAAAPKAEAPAPPVRVPALAELPGDLRQQVPALTIGGSVYSPQASARMVVINGQVFQEGSSLAPELKLEQIRPKTAVFSIRGQRFEVPL